MDQTQDSESALVVPGHEFRNSVYTASSLAKGDETLLTKKRKEAYRHPWLAKMCTLWPLWNWL